MKRPSPTHTFFIATLITLSLAGQKVLARELIQTDISAVKNSGQIQRQTKAVQLVPGRYEIGPIDGKTQKHMLVDSYVNDPEKFLVVIFDQDLSEDKSGSGSIYQARPIRGGTSYMLSPIKINNAGILQVMSEGRTDAPHIIMSSRSGRWKFPYLLQGENGELHNELWGARGGYSKRPSLNANPENNIFVGESQSGEDVMAVLNGTELDLNLGNFMAGSYILTGLNGDLGKFSALTSSDFNTMSEIDETELEIKGLVTFLSGWNNRDAMIVAMPSYQEGKFQFYYVKRSLRNLRDVLLPGRKTPKYSSSESGEM
jgi:hypothetical protein